jgi:hypothetical protein
MRIIDGIAYADDPVPMREVVAVRPMDDYKLWLHFSTGEEKIFDFKPKLDFPVFKPLRDKSLFDSVYIDFGTAMWKNGEIDIAPERLYQDGVPCNKS